MDQRYYLICGVTSFLILVIRIPFQMGRKLWGGEVIGEDTPGLKRSRLNKQKVYRYTAPVQPVS